MNYLNFSMFNVCVMLLCTGCASTYDYQPPVGHPAHSESTSAQMLEPANPFQMEYPYSVTREEIEENASMPMHQGEMQSMEGGSNP